MINVQTESNLTKEETMDLIMNTAKDSKCGNCKYKGDAMRPIAASQTVDGLYYVICPKCGKVYVSFIDVDTSTNKHMLRYCATKDADDYSTKVVREDCVAAFGGGGITFATEEALKEYKMELKIKREYERKITQAYQEGRNDAIEFLKQETDMDKPNDFVVIDSEGNGRVLYQLTIEELEAEINELDTDVETIHLLNKPLEMVTERVIKLK